MLAKLNSTPSAPTATEHYRKPPAEHKAYAKEEDYAQTSFTHIKAKKPEYTENPAVQDKPVAQEVKVEKKPIVQEAAQPSRKQRRQQERLSYVEQKTREYKDQPKEVIAKPEEIVKVNELSDTESDETEEQQQQVWGLESEMKLKSLTNKQAKRRFRKKLQKQADEEAE